MGESRKRLAVAVRASRTTLTGIFGVGPVIAATVLDDAADVSRLASRDHFAACNGTAPVEVSCGNRWACGFPAHQIHHPHGRDHPDPAAPQRQPGLHRALRALPAPAFTLDQLMLRHLDSRRRQVKALPPLHGRAHPDTTGRRSTTVGIKIGRRVDLPAERHTAHDLPDQLHFGKLSEFII
jgi:hypothetical protein